MLFQDFRCLLAQRMLTSPIQGAIVIEDSVPNTMANTESGSSEFRAHACADASEGQPSASTSTSTFEQSPRVLSLDEPRLNPQPSASTSTSALTFDEPKGKGNSTSSEHAEGKVGGVAETQLQCSVSLPPLPPLSEDSQPWELQYYKLNEL
jgi:hypothetical protein